MDRGLIESAVLFGQIDAAVCWQGGERLVFGLDETRTALEPSHTQIGQIGLILDCEAEAEALDGRPFTVDAVCRALIDSSLRHDALRAMLMGMDPDLDDDTRLYAIGDAEELLAAEPARDFVRHRFLGCPFPDEADLDGALRLARWASAERAVVLYEELGRSIAAVDMVRECWNQVLRAQPIGSDLQLAERRLIDEGGFAALVAAVVVWDPVAAASVFRRFASNTALASAIPKYEFHLSGLVLRVLGVLRERDHPRPERAEEGEPEGGSGVGARAGQTHEISRRSARP